MLLLNSPHNPTGRVLDPGELELLAAACRAHDVIALTDEVYEHLVFEGSHIPIATLPGMVERTITVSSIGKTYSVTGWKVGWASGPAELIARLRGVKQFLTFAGGTPLQHAAAAALALPDGDRRGPRARRCARKRDRLAAGLRAAGFDVLPSQATYFLNVDGTPLGEPDATALCERLPIEAGVVAIPTAAFAADPAGPTRSLVRFAFPKGDEVIDEALARLARWAPRVIVGRVEVVKINAIEVAPGRGAELEERFARRAAEVETMPASAASSCCARPPARRATSSTRAGERGALPRWV